MTKLTKSQLWDRANCKVCSHPNREKIEQEILSKKSLTIIANENPPLIKQNVSHHWRNHMKNVLNHRTVELLESEAEKRVNTVIEVNNLFSEWESLYNQLINSLDPQKSDYVAKLNAARQFLTLKNTLCNTNAKLQKDDLDMRNVADVTEMVDKFKKRWKKVKGTNLDIVAIEKTTDDHLQQNI